MANQPKIIKGLRDCVEYFRSIGWIMTIATLKKYIEKGLPCRFEFGTYHFHTDNLDDFFKAWCRQQIANPPDEIEETNGG